MNIKNLIRTICKEVKSCHFFAVFIILLSLISCSENSPKKSATNLLSILDEESLIVKRDTLNVDIINGFRSLKLNTHLDSLNFNDWDEIKFSNEIIVKEKKLKLNVKNRNYDCLSKLTFFNQNLLFIELTFLNIIDDSIKEVSSDLVDAYIYEPQILEPFNLTFGTLNWSRSYKKLDVNNLFPKNMEKLDLDINENFRLSPERTIKLIEKRQKKIKQDIEKYKRENKKVDVNDMLPGESGFYLGITNNSYLYENIGHVNGMKIFLNNQIESYLQNESSIYPNYRLIGSDLVILIFTKNNFKDYLKAKAKQENINIQKAEQEKLNRKKLQDSLNSIKIPSEI